MEMGEWGMGDALELPVASRHVAAELPFPSLPVLLSVSPLFLPPLPASLLVPLFARLAVRLAARFFARRLWRPMLAP
jgi:hypothetical protein